MQLYPYTLDYKNRLVDIELLQSIARPTELQRVNLSVVTQQPKLVTGIQKLAQRYTSILLTAIGSVKFDVRHGSELIKDVTAGIGSKGQLSAVFGLANDDTITQMRLDDNNPDVYGTLPDDERLINATLLDADIDVETSTAYLKIQLNTAAGDSLVFIVPTTTPR
jgi:hypothetical protein